MAIVRRGWHGGVVYGYGGYGAYGDDLTNAQATAGQAAGALQAAQHALVAAKANLAQITTAMGRATGVARVNLQKQLVQAATDLRNAQADNDQANAALLAAQRAVQDYQARANADRAKAQSSMTADQKEAARLAQNAVVSAGEQAKAAKAASTAQGKIDAAAAATAAAAAAAANNARDKAAAVASGASANGNYAAASDLATLAAQVADLASHVSDVATQVSALAQTTQTNSGVGYAAAGDLASTNSALAALAQQVANLPTGGGGGGSSIDTSQFALQSDMSAVIAALNSLQSSGGGQGATGATGAPGASIDTSQFAAQSDMDGVVAALQQLQQFVAQLQSEVETPSTGLIDQLSAAATAIGALNQALAGAVVAGGGDASSYVAPAPSPAPAPAHSWSRGWAGWQAYGAAVQRVRGVRARQTTAQVVASGDPIEAARLTVGNSGFAPRAFRNEVANRLIRRR